MQKYNRGDPFFKIYIFLSFVATILSLLLSIYSFFFNNMQCFQMSVIVQRNLWEPDSVKYRRKITWSQTNDVMGSQGGMNDAAEE